MKIEACVDSNGSPISQYVLYLKERISGTTQAVKTFNDGDTLRHTLTVADDAITPGSLLYFQYSAINSIGESAKSREVSYALAAFPPAPTGLTKVDHLSTINSIYL